MEPKLAIIHSAKLLFLGNSYTEVSVREISTLAGISHTYVHKLFGSKRQLFTEVLCAADMALHVELITPSHNFYSVEGSDLFRLLARSAIAKAPSDIVAHWAPNSLSIAYLCKRLGKDSLIYGWFSSMLFDRYLADLGILQAQGWDSDHVERIKETREAWATGFAEGRSNGSDNV